MTYPVTRDDPDPPSWPGVHADLLAAKTRLYDPCGFVCSQLVPEPEGAAYGAYEFALDGRSVRYRVAKTTPTKVGQFVTLWKRPGPGPIAPFDAADPVDLFVVSCRDGDHFGQFVFSREVLRERGVLSRAGAGGKRAIRVYPPWVTTSSRQAGATQTWQLEHFLPIPVGRRVDAARARALHHP
ncbi:MepB family protein [Rhodococcus sp. NPDC059234]|uniref:MepB family protein n=1 Tax=Rhodococcus sp. NPDC059234 TaxID=3346781 RepID=UPI003673526C